MHTSQYGNRNSVKKCLRSPEVVKILNNGRIERQALEAKPSERNAEIGHLRAAIQSQIDRGVWDPTWATLGFTQPDATSK